MELFCRCIYNEGNADVCKESAPSGGRGRRTTRKNICPDHTPVAQLDLERVATNDEVVGSNPARGTNK